jgi:hypothetical protein
MPTMTNFTTGGDHPCRNPRCNRMARSNISYSCNTCRQKVRVHGDWNQTLIRKHELRAFIARAREAVERGNAPLVRSSLTQIAGLLKDHSRRVVEGYMRGTPTARWSLKAHSEVLKITEASDPMEPALVVAGMHLLRRDNPRRFASDSGFNGQIVRQVRSLHGIAMGRTTTLATGIDRGWFRPLPVRTTAEIARIVHEAYSRFAVHVLSSVENAEAKMRKVSADLDRAFSGVSQPAEGAA